MTTVPSTPRDTLKDPCSELHPVSNPAAPSAPIIAPAIILAQDSLMPHPDNKLVSQLAFSFVLLVLMRFSLIFS